MISSFLNVGVYQAVGVYQTLYVLTLNSVQNKLNLKKD